MNEGLRSAQPSVREPAEDRSPNGRPCLAPAAAHDHEREIGEEGIVQRELQEERDVVLTLQHREDGRLVEEEELREEERDQAEAEG